MGLLTTLSSQDAVMAQLRLSGLVPGTLHNLADCSLHGETTSLFFLEALSIPAQTSCSKVAASGAQTVRFQSEASFNITVLGLVCTVHELSLDNPLGKNPCGL